MELDSLEDLFELTLCDVVVKLMSRPSSSDPFNMYASSATSSATSLLFCRIVNELSIKKIFVHQLAIFKLQQI